MFEQDRGDFGVPPSQVLTEIFLHDRAHRVLHWDELIPERNRVYDEDASGLEQRPETD